MDLLKQARRQLIQWLWKNYQQAVPQAAAIHDYLTQNNSTPITLDHLAIIDLPGPNTGLSQLYQIFSALGFIVQGRDYLPDKQNEFLWMAEIDALQKPAKDVLPQIVLADFWLDELPSEIRKIIYKYSHQAPKAPVNTLQKLCGRIFLGDAQAIAPLMKLLTTYLSGRDWPLPDFKSVKTVQEFNELLAWTLVFGRVANHFSIPVHLLKDQFASLKAFNELVSKDLEIPLNCSGGLIKGVAKIGIEQSSTQSSLMPVPLADNMILLPDRFMEFVWRYPINNKPNPIYWEEYYTGFIPQHANHVIESLYTQPSVS